MLRPGVPQPLAAGIRALPRGGSIPAQCVMGVRSQKGAGRFPSHP